MTKFSFTVALVTPLWLLNKQKKNQKYLKDRCVKTIFNKKYDQVASDFGFYIGQYFAGARFSFRLIVESIKLCSVT